MTASPSAEPEVAEPQAGASARLRTAAWVIYDLANTVYIATITFVFTPFAEQELGGLSSHARTNFLSMLAAGLLVPFFGALTDTTLRTRRYLALSTLVCIVALAGWHFDCGSFWLLACFFLANLAYNIALVFYNSLLTSVAPPARAGRISGLGVGVGYLGTILVLVVLLTTKPAPRTFFLVASALFLVFALPCMVLVRDRRRAPANDAGSERTTDILLGANRRLLATLRELPQHRALMWFLLANFCLVDVLNTAILYFAQFTKSVFAEQAEAGVVLFGTEFVGQEGIDSFMALAGLCLNLIAMLAGFLIGRWTDRAPLAVMRVSALALLVALIGGAVFGGNSPLGYLATLVAGGAFGLTGIWTAGRKVVVLLAPPAEVGRYFGLYGITLKLSVFGSLLYAAISDTYGSKPAMLAQSSQLLLGLLCLFMVKLPTAPSDA